MSYEDLTGNPGPDRIVTIHVPDSSSYSVSLSAVPHYVSEFKIRNLLSTIDGLQQSIDRSYRQDNAALLQFTTKIPVLFPLLHRIINTVKAAFATILPAHEMKRVTEQYTSHLSKYGMKDLHSLIRQQQQELLNHLVKMMALTPPPVQSSSSPSLVDLQHFQNNPRYLKHSVRRTCQQYRVILMAFRRLSRSMYRPVGGLPIPQKYHKKKTSRQPDPVDAPCLTPTASRLAKITIQERPRDEKGTGVNSPSAIAPITPTLPSSLPSPSPSLRPSTRAGSRRLMEQQLKQQQLLQQQRLDMEKRQKNKRRKFRHGKKARRDARSSSTQLHKRRKRTTSLALQQPSRRGGHRALDTLLFPQRIHEQGSPTQHEFALLDCHQLNQQYQHIHQPNGGESGNIPVIFGSGTSNQVCTFCRSQQQQFLQQVDGETPIFTSSTSFHPQSIKTPQTTQKGEGNEMNGAAAVESIEHSAMITASIMNESTLPRSSTFKHPRGANPDATPHDSGPYAPPSTIDVFIDPDNTIPANSGMGKPNSSIKVYFDAIGACPRSNSLKQDDTMISTALLNKRLVHPSSKSYKNVSSKCTCSMIKAKSSTSTAATQPLYLSSPNGSSASGVILRQHAHGDATPTTHHRPHHAYSPFRRGNRRSLIQRLLSLSLQHPIVLKDLSITTVDDKRGKRAYYALDQLFMPSKHHSKHLTRLTNDPSRHRVTGTKTGCRKGTPPMAHNKHFDKTNRISYKQLPIPSVHRLRHQQVFTSRARKGLLLKPSPLIGPMAWSALIIAIKYPALVPHFMQCFPLSSSASSTSALASPLNNPLNKVFPSSHASPASTHRKMTQGRDLLSSDAMPGTVDHEAMDDGPSIDTADHSTSSIPSTKDSSSSTGSSPPSDSMDDAPLGTTTAHKRSGCVSVDAPKTATVTNTKHIADLVLRQLSCLPLASQIYIYNIVKTSSFPYSMFHPPKTTLKTYEKPTHTRPSSTHGKRPRALATSNAIVPTSRRGHTRSTHGARRKPPSHSPRSAAMAPPFVKDKKPYEVGSASFALSLFYQLPFAISLFSLYMRQLTFTHTQQGNPAASLISMTTRLTEQLRQVQNSVSNFALNYKHPWRIMSSPFQPLSYNGAWNTPHGQTSHGNANASASSSAGIHSTTAASVPSSTAISSPFSFSSNAMGGSGPAPPSFGLSTPSIRPSREDPLVLSDTSLVDHGASSPDSKSAMAPPYCLTLQDEYRLYSTFGLPANFYNSIGLQLTSTQQQQLQQHIQSQILSTYDLSFGNLPQFCLHQQHFQQQHHYFQHYQQFPSLLQQQYQNQYQSIASSVLALSLNNCIIDGVNMRVLRHSAMTSFALAYNLQLSTHPYLLFFHSRYSSSPDACPARLLIPSLRPDMLVAQFSLNLRSLLYPHDVYEPQQLSMLYPNAINTMPHFDDDGMLSQASASRPVETISSALALGVEHSSLGPSIGIAPSSSTSSLLLSDYANTMEARAHSHVTALPCVSQLQQRHNHHITTNDIGVGQETPHGSKHTASPAMAPSAAAVMGSTDDKTLSQMNAMVPTPMANGNSACETIMAMGIPVERYIDMILLKFARIIQSKPYAYMMDAYDFDAAVRRKRRMAVIERQVYWRQQGEMGDGNKHHSHSESCSSIKTTHDADTLHQDDSMKDDHDGGDDGPHPPSNTPSTHAIEESDPFYQSLSHSFSELDSILGAASAKTETLRETLGHSSSPYGFSVDTFDTMYSPHFAQLMIPEDANLLAEDMLQALSQHEDYQKLATNTSAFPTNLSFLESVVEPHCSLINPHQCHDPGHMSQSSALYHNIMSSSATTSTAPYPIPITPSQHPDSNISPTATTTVGEPSTKRIGPEAPAAIAATPRPGRRGHNLATPKTAPPSQVEPASVKPQDSPKKPPTQETSLHHTMSKRIAIRKRMLVKDTPSFERFRSLLGWYLCRKGCIEEFSIDIQRLLFARLHAVMATTGVFTSGQFQPQYLSYLQQYAYLYTDKTKWMVTDNTLIPYTLEKVKRQPGDKLHPSSSPTHHMVAQSTVIIPKPTKTKTSSSRVTHQRLQAQIRWEKQNARNQEQLQQQLNTCSKKGDGVVLTSEQLSLCSSHVNAPTATLSSSVLSSSLYSVYFNGGIIPQSSMTTLSEYCHQISNPLSSPIDPNAMGIPTKAWSGKKRFGLAATKAAAMSSATSVASSSLSLFSQRGPLYSSSFASSSSSSPPGTSSSAAASSRILSAFASSASTPHMKPSTNVGDDPSLEGLAVGMNSNATTTMNDDGGGVSTPGGLSLTLPSINGEPAAGDGYPAAPSSPGAAPSATGTIGPDGIEYFTLIPPQNSHTPAYCFCQTISLGRMVACENKTCPYEWFHFQCIGLSQSPKGAWYCLYCLQNSLHKRAHGKAMKKYQSLIQNQREVLTNNGLLPRAHDTKAPINPQVYHYGTLIASPGHSPTNGDGGYPSSNADINGANAIVPAPPTAMATTTDIASTDSTIMPSSMAAGSQTHQQHLMTDTPTANMDPVHAMAHPVASCPPSQPPMTAAAPAPTPTPTPPTMPSHTQHVGRNTSGGTPYVKSARIAAAAAAAAAHQRQQYDAMLHSYATAQAAAAASNMNDSEGNIACRVASLRARPHSIAASASAVLKRTPKAPPAKKRAPPKTKQNTAPAHRPTTTAPLPSPAQRSRQYHSTANPSEPSEPNPGLDDTRSPNHDDSMGDA